MESISYSDGVVTIRSLGVNDIDADLAAKDDEQIEWMWEPGERESWESMTLDEQREHALGTLRECEDSFGPGPKWAFAVDTQVVKYVAYIDCDLANRHVPSGQASIAYSAHPTYRGEGYVSRAVRLVLQFLRESTNAREAHINIDADNVASLRVAQAVGAVVAERWIDDRGRTMNRHVVALH